MDLKVIGNAISSNAKQFGKFLWKNSATIAVATGAGGFIGASIYIAKVAPEAKEALDKAQEESEEELTLKEKVEILLPYYWKPALIELVSTGCFIFSEVKHRKTELGLAAALKLYEHLNEDFRQGSLKEVGERKTDAIIDKANQETARGIDFDPRRIECTGLGDQLWVDASISRPFRCSAEAIHQAENEIKLQIWANDSATLNDLYCKLNLEPVEFGNVLGWQIDDIKAKYKGLCDFKYFKDNIPLLDTSTAGVTPDEESYMIMSFFSREGLYPTWVEDWE